MHKNRVGIRWRTTASEDDDRSDISASECNLNISSKAFANNKSCLQCNSKDQIEVLNKFVCLCELRFQLHYSSFERRRNQHINRSMIFENPGQIYNYINKCRKWVKVWNPTNISKDVEFSLTTYNILAQNLLLNHLYLYQGNTKSDLAWHERGERLKQEIIEMNSDILCLQEVHMENFKNTILPSLTDLGYEAVFKQKTGTNFDGCSILFKKNKFQLQDSLSIDFNRTDISRLLDKDNVALVVKLRPVGLRRPANTNLIIANTHLLFNPGRGDIKIAQLRLLLAEIQRFARCGKTNCTDNPYKLNYSPIILCGDMNSEPKSPLINFIEKGHLNLYDMKSGNISGQKEGFDKGNLLVPNDLLMKNINADSCYATIDNSQQNQQNGDQLNSMTIKHVFDLKSVYPNIDEFNKKLISTSTYYDCGLVDHIFYSYKHKNLRLSAFKQLLNRRNISNIGNIPNSILGSDHIALSAKFYIL